MRFQFKSAAKARAVFHPGTTREQAWENLTKMFRDQYAGSLVGGGYSLSPLSTQGPPSTISLGDSFKYATHTDTHYVRITSWNPLQSFAYDEFWKPINGEQYDDPNTADDVKDTMEFVIGNHPEALVLDVRRTQKLYVPLFRAIVLAPFNTQGGAFTALSGLLGPKSREATGWAGGWKRLPLDTNNATIKPDRFNGPSLIK